MFDMFNTSGISCFIMLHTLSYHTEHMESLQYFVAAPDGHIGTRLPRVDLLTFGVLGVEIKLTFSPNELLSATRQLLPLWQQSSLRQTIAMAVRVDGDEDADTIVASRSTSVDGVLAVVATSVAGVFNFVSSLFARPFWIGIPGNIHIESVTLIDALGRTIELEVHMTWEVSVNSFTTSRCLLTNTIPGGPCGSSPRVS